MKSSLRIKDNIRPIEVNALVSIAFEKELLANEIFDRGSLPARIGQHFMDPRQGLQAPLEVAQEFVGTFG